MIPREAIERAIEGGWKWTQGGNTDLTSWVFDKYEGAQWQEIALDATFWQALGKALEWGVDKRDEGGVYKPSYRAYAEVFYDLILTKGDTEAFWRDLLKANDK